MVKGLDLFRERFQEFSGSFILIGGVACKEWFAADWHTFRPTVDLDVVLIIELIDRPFVRALRSFIAEGAYEIRQRTEGTPVLYRFAKPKDERFPAELELFSRRPEGLNLEEGQTIVPIQVGADHHSLSAILLNEDYYQLIQTHKDVRDGLPMVNATALIAMKAYAWINLTKGKAAGETIDAKKIAKHRNDVFRLAGSLPGDPGPILPPTITNDITRFLESFPVSSSEWPSILASLKDTSSGGLRPAALRNAIQTYFSLQR